MGRYLHFFSDEGFEGDYNRMPFVLRHELTSHPLFTLESLLDLAEGLPKNDVLHYCADIPVTADFDHAAKTHPNGLSLEQTLRRIDHVGSYVLIKNAQKDPAYRQLLDSIINEDISPRLRWLDPGIRDRVMYIFVSSPGSVTPYHLDRETNFLLQIRGEKRVHLWDPNDRSVITERDLETFFAHPEWPRPAFREEFQSKAMQFDLTPGLGVHHPFAAPHWVKNGNQVSISVAITYRTRASDRKARAHAMNFHLRRAGLRPLSFGELPPLDWVKSWSYRAMTQALPLYRLWLKSWNRIRALARA